MAKPMKVLIAYDGSPCSDEAIEDLQRAGLPADVEAVVLSVADVWLLPEGQPVAPGPLRPSIAMREARATATAMKIQAQSLAESAKLRLQALFPTWQISAESATNSPAWAIVVKAEQWGADLIVVGSHGHSSLGRWVMGSTSQTVLTQAFCSVRIARGRRTLPDHPLRILVGIDGSRESELAVQSVASRMWPEGTDIRLVMVLNPSIIESMKAGPFGTEQLVTMPLPADAESLDSMIQEMLAHCLETVRANPSGVTVSTSLLSGDPKHVLLQEAELWGADCIFIGSRGLNRWERLLLGSVSTALAVRAHCPVEVVRGASAP